MNSGNEIGENAHLNRLLRLKNLQYSAEEKKEDIFR